MVLDFILIIVLVLMNGFFVAAEFAIVKVRASQIEVKIKEGSSTAILANHILLHLNSYLSATQLGITMASLGLGWIGEDASKELIMAIFNKLGYGAHEALAHSIALPASFIFITFIHITFGELAPKTIAIQSPDKTTFAIAWPLRIFYKIFQPLIWCFNEAANAIVRLFGVEPLGHQEEHSTEELKIILSRSKESGAINDDNDLIENVFTFNETTAKQIMVPRTKFAALEVSAPDQEILQKIDSEGYSRMPVYKNTIDDIVGIVHTKDILSMVLKGEPVVLSNILRPAYLIPETKTISTLLKDFQRKRVHMAIVIDEFGGTSGIVTMEDIIEELVGEIQDEYDEEKKPMIEKVQDGQFVVSALASIKDVNEFLRYPLPEGDEFETIAGLMNFIFGKIPEVDEVCEFGGYLFTILSSSAKTAETVRILEVLKEDD